VRNESRKPLTAVRRNVVSTPNPLVEHIRATLLLDKAWWKKDQVQGPYRPNSTLHPNLAFKEGVDHGLHLAIQYCEHAGKLPPSTGEVGESVRGSTVPAEGSGMDDKQSRGL
jgi:hypothetical protein